MTSTTEGAGMIQPTIFLGDCIEVMRSLPENSVDSIVTDPPYGLGFMGKAWDELPPGEEWARECLRVLKPGGHMLAFGGTRTWHRLAVAVEDAGFEVRDSIAWLYGSGFPKSLDVSKTIDRANGRSFEDRFPLGQHIRERREALGLARTEVNGWLGAATKCEHYESTSPGFARVPTLADFAILRDRLGLSDEYLPLVERAEAERAVIGSRIVPDASKVRPHFAGATYQDGYASKSADITVPATDAARQWQGWGTALKPAFEPVVVARKPLTGTVAANVLQHGTGALNIDGCRVATEDPLGREWTANMGGAFAFNGFSTKSELEAAAAVDGRTPNGRSARATLEKVNRRTTPQEAPTGRWPANVVLDEAQAERFAESRFFYVAKAPTKERPKVDGVAHPTVKPLALMRWLVRLVTPPGGTVLEPFAGSGTTVEAAVLEGFRCVAIEREADYLPLIQARLNRAASSAPQPEPVGDSLFDLEEPA